MNPLDRIFMDHDPVAVLNDSLDALPIWKHTDAHVYWEQDGCKHLQMKDYMVSSIQVHVCVLSLILLMLNAGYGNLLVARSCGFAAYPCGQSNWHYRS
jgi:hypothetical protein